MTKQKLQIRILNFTILPSFLLSFQLLAITPPKTGPSPNVFSDLDLNSAPKPTTWKAFMQTPVADMMTYILTHHLYKPESGLDTRKVKWEWRMGIIRKCQKSNDVNCRKLLASTLNDPALVVRNEAVTSFATRYQGSGNREALEILEHVFSDPKNYRNGKPLFVQKKILYAIHEIGGLEARSLGHRLSSGHSELKSYWSKL